MSKKRKEELEQNELADRLEKQFEAAKPYLPIAGAIVGVIILLIGGGVWYYHSQKAKRAAVWKELGEAVQQSNKIAGSTSALDSFANDNPDTDAALWAKFFAGDIEIKNATMIDPRNGKPAWLADKKKAFAGLEKAKTYLKDVVNSDRKMDKMLRRRATFALAYAHESLGEFDEAKGYYAKLVEEGEASPLYHAARLGVSRSGSPEIKEFFTMFNSWDTFGDAPSDQMLPTIPNIEFTDEIREKVGGGDFDPGAEKNDAPKPPGDSDKKSDTGKSGENKKDDQGDKKADDKKEDDKKESKKSSDSKK